MSMCLIQYDECIEDCDKAVERGRELRSDYKMVARALTRKGTALTKMAKNSKDYEPAIEAFQKALTEHRNPDTLKRLNEAERAKKEWEQKEYFNPQIGDEEREKGYTFAINLVYSIKESFKNHKTRVNSCFTVADTVFLIQVMYSSRSRSTLRL